MGATGKLYLRLTPMEEMAKDHQSEKASIEIAY